MRNARWIALAAIALVAACETPAEDAGTPEETAAVDAAAIEDSIRATDARWEEAMRAGDAAAVAALYTDDAILLAPGAPRVEGKAGIESAFTPMAQAVRDIELGTDRVDVAESGEMATEIGTYSLTMETPDGATIEDVGKYVVVWKNVDGTWRLAVDIFNSDLPPGGAAPEDAAGSSDAGADSTM